MIRLTSEQLRQIADHGAAEYPNECCGLLVGDDESDGSITVVRVVPSPNVASERRADRFEVDPQIRIDLEIELRDRRDRRDRIIGHYHSHPDHPARPSETDLERALEPELIWLIISVEEGRAGAPRAYKLDSGGDGFTEVEISISAKEA